MSYKVESMSIDDFDAVLRLWRNAEGIGLNESDTRSAITSYLARNPGMSFVARSGRKIVGAVLCGHDGRRGFLHHLAIAPAHKGKGLGKKLVAACQAQLEQAGISKCNIFLFADNKKGESFWKHNGWVKRSDLRVMQKPITAAVDGCGC